MGRAEIISNYGEGRYRVRLIYDRVNADAEIAALTDENTALDTSRPDMAQAVTDAQNALYYASDVLSAVINDPESTEQEKQAAADKVNNARNTLYSHRQALAFLDLRKAANLRRVAYIEQHTPTTEEMDAWCADYNEELTGIVGTIETSRQRENQTPVIRPAGVDGDLAGHLPARDGIHQPVTGSTPAATFFNYALLPGADNHKPLYKAGIISNINTTDDTCTVSLVPVTVGHQDLVTADIAPINNVPVSYLSCNAAAFAPDDLVIVEFTAGWESGTVVGFVSHPRPCGGDLWLRITINGNQCLRGGQQIVLRYTNTSGSTVTTPARVIPAVGAPLDVDELISVPVANQSLAGPFALTDWDENPVEVLLHRERKNDNTGVDFKYQTASAGLEQVRGLSILYDYYVDVGDNYADANIVVNQEDYIVYVDRAANEESCFDLGMLRRVYLAGNGINTTINAPDPDSWNWQNRFSTTHHRGGRIGNYKRLNYYPIAQVSAAQIAAAVVDNVLDLATGETVVGETLDVAGSAVFKAALYDFPQTTPNYFSKGTFRGTTHTRIYNDEGNEDDELLTITNDEREPWEDLIFPRPEDVYLSEGCYQEINPTYGYLRLVIPPGGTVGLVVDYSQGAGSGFYLCAEIEQDTTLPTHAIANVGSNGILMSSTNLSPIVRPTTGPNRPASHQCFEVYFAQLEGETMSAGITFPEGAVTTWAQPFRMAGYKTEICTPRACTFTSYAYKAVERDHSEVWTDVPLSDALLRPRKVYPEGRAVGQTEAFAPFYALISYFKPRVSLQGYASYITAVPHHSTFEKIYSKADVPLLLFDELNGEVTGPSTNITEVEENLLDQRGSLPPTNLNFSETINYQYIATGVEIDVAGYL